MKRVQKYLGKSVSQVFFDLADDVSYTSMSVRSVAVENPPRKFRSFHKSSIIILYDEKSKVCMIDERIWHEPSERYLRWVTHKAKHLMRGLPKGAQLKISPSKDFIDVFVRLDSWFLCMKGDKMNGH